MGIEHENNVGIRPTVHIDQRNLGRVVNNAGPRPIQLWPSDLKGHASN